MCQRYYEIIRYTAANAAILSGLLTGTYHNAQWNFAVAKRTSPTVALATGSWNTNTPTIYPQEMWCGFRSANGYFYAGGTSGDVALTASAEL